MVVMVVVVSVGGLLLAANHVADLHMEIMTANARRGSEVLEDTA